MIPKIIHYCWFGKNPQPKLAIKCIDSWKKHCLNYKIIEWNEDNFDIRSNTYVREAYESKKWAFVSDYVRLYALCRYGGIYMDTDVEVLKPLDTFLKEKAFSGFEAYDRVPTGIMGSEKSHPFFTMLLDYYTDKRFVLDDGRFDYTTNVEIITKYCCTRGLNLNNTKQTIENFTLYPSDYFCPKDCITKEVNLTPNSYTIHHFDGSWVSKTKKINCQIRMTIKNILGKQVTQKVIDFKKRLK